MYIVLQVEYPLFLWRCNETWIFSTDFSKYPSIKFHKNPSKLFHADKQFSQFCESAQKSIIFVFAVQNHCYYYYYSKVKFSLILLFKQNYFSIIIFYISVIVRVFPDSPLPIVCRKHARCFLDAFVCTSRTVSTKPRSYLKCGQWTQQRSLD
jgi:hypothetical protein